MTDCGNKGWRLLVGTFTDNRVKALTGHREIRKNWSLRIKQKVWLDALERQKVLVVRRETRKRSDCFERDKEKIWLFGERQELIGERQGKDLVDRRETMKRPGWSKRDKENIWLIGERQGKDLVDRRETRKWCNWLKRKTNSSNRLEEENKALINWRETRKCCRWSERENETFWPEATKKKLYLFG